MNDLIISGVELVKFEIHPDIYTLRATALKTAEHVKGVTSEASRAFAFDALKGLETVSRATESARKRVKGPIDVLVDQIQDQTKEFQAPMKERIDWLKRELGAYDMMLREQAAEEERKRVAELNRIEEEKRKQEQVILEAARLGQAEALKAALEKQKELNKEVREVIVPIKSEKIKGAAVRQDWEVEILDAELLEKEYPGLFDHVLNMTRVKQALEMGARLPGVKAEKVAKLGTRG
jgi:hypothetical protein